MRVFEEDITKKMAGEPENELANDATIRFEIDDVQFTVMVNAAKELSIRKTKDSGLETIWVGSVVSNMISVR